MQREEIWIEEQKNWKQTVEVEEIREQREKGGKKIGGKN